MISDDLKARFWAKVDRRGPGECWPWRGDADPQGYGKIRVNYRRNFAHRIALSIATGREPGSEVLALHSCDNPPCCNPAHLRWGTPKDNYLDRRDRGQCRLKMDGMLGIQNGRARLTEDQVRAIRTDPRPGAVIAAELGVAKPTINHIKARRTWRHLGE